MSAKRHTIKLTGEELRELLLLLLLRGARAHTGGWIHTLVVSDERLAACRMAIGREIGHDVLAPWEELRDL